MVEHFFNLQPLLILPVVDKYSILNVCQCLKNPEKNVLVAVKRRRGQVISIVVINVSMNFNTNLILKNGRAVRLGD